MIINLLKTAIYSSIFLAICFTVTIIYFLNLLPKYESLENYKPNVMSRVHAADGKLIREFSREYRIFIPIEDIPENTIIFNTEQIESITENWKKKNIKSC